MLKYFTHVIFQCQVRKYNYMNVIDISQKNPIVRHYMAEIRDVDKQQYMCQFRRNIYKLGILLAVESSKELDYQHKTIKTPFSKANVDRLIDYPIIYSIIRAGIKLQEGVSVIYEDSLCGFSTCKKDCHGMRRAELYTLCETTNKIVFVCDPIAATGNSIIETVRAIEANGMPSKIIILNIITTPLAINNIQNAIKESTSIYTCAIDDFTKGIRGTMPGLGDVGDLLYGKNK